jgi:3-phosphoshikimate 1-carboxyvinyltransferase
MSNAYRISCPQAGLKGSIILEPSKSISNRVLIVRSLCKEDFKIHRLSNSDDTDALVKMLASDKDVLYSGHAGSSYRFMVARACLGDKEIKLDASEQLRRRQIGPLVKALQTLGADITYLNKEGYPPLQIKPNKNFGKGTNEISLQAGISSQYVTALLMIAPYLPKGLIINLSEHPVSVPYIQMTLEVMKWFGIDHEWKENTITIQPGEYKAKDYSVEGDWSAAGYFYSMAALAPVANIEIEGLYEKSLQGDAIVKEIFEHFGVTTTFTETGIQIKKKDHPPRPKEVRYDFTNYPDLGQTVMVTLAGMGVKGILSGLKTLRIKETDRIEAMQTELAKVKIKMDIIDKPDDIICVLTGKAKWKDKAKFNTYEDHRMAMALTPLALIKPIIIREPEVVSKSYPGFWRDASQIGLKTERVK